MNIPILTDEQLLSAMQNSRKRVTRAYRAMYSSWWGGITTQPEMMLVPIDDHLVHRGDGVFEAVRVIDKAYFDLDAHLSRLERSAAAIGMKLPVSLDELKEICVQTARASGLRDAALRLYVGRGPGSFSPNPYESVGPQIYAVITEFKSLSESSYENGVTALTSKVPQKEPFYSQIKSCNYLPNVLMKKEAVDHGVDFSLGISGDGVLREGPTENLIFISQERRLKVPKFDYTLRGTTLIALLEALEKQPLDGIDGIDIEDLRLDHLLRAREVYMVGTTLEVLPVVKVNEKSIESGKVGPLAAPLRRLLQKEMRENSRRRTVID